MRTLIALGIALVVLGSVGGCKEELPPTRPLEGNRGAIKPGGVRAIKTGETKPQPPSEKP